MDSFKINLSGFDEVINNLSNIPKKLKVALLLDSKNVASQMEAWAKTNAPWEDQTGDARKLMKAHVKWEGPNLLSIKMSHHVNYGVYLELCNEGKYAVLEKAINEFVPEFQEGWKDILSRIGE